MKVTQWTKWNHIALQHNTIQNAKRPKTKYNSEITNKKTIKKKFLTCDTLKWFAIRIQRSTQFVLMFAHFQNHCHKEIYVLCIVVSSAIFFSEKLLQSNEMYTNQIRARSFFCLFHSWFADSLICFPFPLPFLHGKCEKYPFKDCNTRAKTIEFIVVESKRLKHNGKLPNWRKRL